MILVSIDPGLRAQGVAVFRDHTLVAATLIRVPGKERGPAQWVRMAYATRDWIGTAPLTSLEFGNGFMQGQWSVVSEYPQSYIASQQKGDQADILELAGVVGATCAELGGTVTGLLPQQWKGQVPKDVMVARILARLTVEEKALYDALDVPASLLHNVADGIGVALHHLGRLNKKRVI